ncbi:MAG: hypothetical protein KBT31_03615 [Firmicutes bacterium]|nr:hypothetical protein [Candidatus Colimorpha enterica]
MAEKQKPQLFDTGTFESLEIEGDIERSTDTTETGVGNLRDPEGSGAKPKLAGTTVSGDGKQVFFGDNAKEEMDKRLGLSKEAKTKTKRPKKQKKGRETGESLGKYGAVVSENGEKKKKEQTVKVEKIKFGEGDGLFPENKYFKAMGRKYARLKIITMILAAVIGLGMFVGLSKPSVNGANGLTLEGFKYLLKDLDFSNFSSSEIDKMVYTGGVGATFGIYRGDLVVVNGGVTTLCKATGAISFSSENDYYSPRLLVSDKYFLVYDVGKTSYGFSVYNSFTDLISRTLDYPILTAAISDSGAFAIVSADENYRSVVYVYDGALNEVMQVKKEKYVLSVDLSDDGKTLLVASVIDSDGDSVTEISVIDVEKCVEKQNIEVAASVPMQVRHMSGGKIAVVYTDRITIYDSDGVKLSDIQPSSTTLAYGHVGNDFIVTVCNKEVIGDDKLISFYDGLGRPAFTVEESGEYMEAKSLGDHLYLLFRDHAVRINAKTGDVKSQKVKTGAIAIVIDSQGGAFACYSDNAQALRFD